MLMNWIMKLNSSKNKFRRYATVIKGIVIIIKLYTFTLDTARNWKIQESKYWNGRETQSHYDRTWGILLCACPKLTVRIDTLTATATTRRNCHYKGHTWCKILCSYTSAGATESRYAYFLYFGCSTNLSLQVLSHCSARPTVIVQQLQSYWVVTLESLITTSYNIWE